MRVNIYAEEMPDEPRVEIVEKTIDGQTFTGLRIYLELPVASGGMQIKGPFMHSDGDDDSAAVTFWGKRALRATLLAALRTLDDHHAGLAVINRRDTNGDAEGKGPDVAKTGFRPIPSDSAAGQGAARALDLLDRVSAELRHTIIR